MKLRGTGIGCRGTPRAWRAGCTILSNTAEMPQSALRHTCHSLCQLAETCLETASTGSLMQVLERKLRLQQERVQELERVIERLRAQQFSSSQGQAPAHVRLCCIQGHLEESGGKGH